MAALLATISHIRDDGKQFCHASATVGGVAEKAPMRLNAD
jgi:hypothetical protein